MINVLRADIYRLTRDKALYATFGAVILMAAILVLPIGGGGGVLGLPVNLYFDNDGPAWLDGFHAATVLLPASSALTFFLIPVVVIAGRGHFADGAVRNSLTTGISRTRLYLATWIISSALTVVMFVVYLGSGIGLATLAHGPGYWLWTQRIVGWYKLPEGTVYSLLMLLALTSIAVFLGFAIRKTAVAMAIYVLFSIVPLLLLFFGTAFFFYDGSRLPYRVQNLLVYTSPFLNVWFPTMADFDPAHSIPSEVWLPPTVSAAWIASTTLAGIYRFSRMAVQ